MPAIPDVAPDYQREWLPGPGDPRVPVRRSLIMRDTVARTREGTGSVRRALAVLGLLAATGMLIGACGPGGPPAPSSDTPPTQSAPADVRSTGRDRYDLGRDEARGGHTLERHGGRSEDELEDRLDRAGNRPNLVLAYNGTSGQSIGRSLRRGSRSAAAPDPARTGMSSQP
jgi:hypothetical protein